MSGEKNGGKLCAEPQAHERLGTNVFRTLAACSLHESEDGVQCRYTPRPQHGGDDGDDSITGGSERRNPTLGQT